MAREPGRACERRVMVCYTGTAAPATASTNGKSYKAHIGGSLPDKTASSGFRRRQEKALAFEKNRWTEVAALMREEWSSSKRNLPHDLTKHDALSKRPPPKWRPGGQGLRSGGGGCGSVGRA